MCVFDVHATTTTTTTTTTIAAAADDDDDDDDVMWMYLFVFVVVSQWPSLHCCYLYAHYVDSRFEDKDKDKDLYKKDGYRQRNVRQFLQSA